MIQTNEQLSYYAPKRELIEKKTQNFLREEFKGIDKENIQNMLASKIEKYQKELYGAKISLCFRDLKKNMNDFDIQGDNMVWAASVIKVPVMIEVFNQISQGKISLEDKLLVDHKYWLEKYDLTTLKPEGSYETIEKLLYNMIVYSDNEATNMLANTVGLENINKTAADLGAKKTMMAHLICPNAQRLYADFNLEGSNVTTAKDMAVLLEKVYKHEAGSKENCRKMGKLLEEKSATYLGSMLPKEAIIGNKIGIISDTNCGDDLNDVGVINRDYILSVMINKIGIDRIKRSRQILPSLFNGFLNGNRSKENLVEKEMEEDLKKAYDLLDKYHESTLDKPFYFTAHLTPINIKTTNDPSRVLGLISRVVYDVYYKRKK